MTHTSPPGGDSRKASIQPGLAMAIVLLALMLVGCRTYGTDPSPPDGAEITTPEASEVSVDRIIYVSPEGDLITIKPDGTNPQRLTGGTQLRAGPEHEPSSQVGEPLPVRSLELNNFYTWPTWSPDGTRLAASRVQVSGDGELQFSVQIIHSTTHRAQTVFTNEIPAPILNGVPHYLHWSPDGRYLAIIASTPRGLTLFTVDTRSDDGPVAVETGAPIYFSWAAAGNSLLIHVGPDVKLAQTPFDSATTQLLASTGGFRVPAFSPSGHRLAFPLFPGFDDPGGSLFFSAMDQPENLEAVLDLDAVASFMWSPDGDAMAVADRTDPSVTIFQRLRVVSADGKSVQTITEDPLVAFYWSPDAKQIAWISLVPEERTFQWKVASRQGEGVRELFRFHPSGDTFTMLSFFDQYAYSHTPWSPDSSHLVVAGTSQPSSDRRNGQTPTGSRVFVLDVEGSVPARDIAAGTLAFWSRN